MSAPWAKSRHVAVANDVDSILDPALATSLGCLLSVNPFDEDDGRMFNCSQHVNTNCVLGHSHIPAELSSDAVIPTVDKKLRNVRIGDDMNPNTMAINSE